MPSPSNTRRSLSKHWLESDWLRYGADASDRTLLSLSQASQYCRKLALNHYENFSIASLFVPRHLRQHLYHVYAYCRWSDDLADESSNPMEASERLDWWQNQLDDCFRNRVHHPVMIALLSTIRTFDLPQQPFDDLLSAFRQDQSVTRYETDEQLLDYCRRSANPVGRILLSMAEIDDASSLHWSDQICTGLQLANFCQDMKRDAAKERIYFPRSRWSPDQITESMILRGQTTPMLCRGILRWIEEIRERLDDGWKLAEHVPKWLARDVRLFAGGGLMILQRIEENGGDVWSHRLEVSSFAKLRLLLHSLLVRTSPWRRVKAGPNKP